MNRSITRISLLYISASFLCKCHLCILVFQKDGCCDDSEMTFADKFAFTVQTATTVGYGVFSPHGYNSSFFVVILCSVSVLPTYTIFGGLIFAQYSRRDAKIEFSSIIICSNFNGLPCLSIRVGNVDGPSNKLIEVNGQLTCSYSLSFIDEDGETHKFDQTVKLKPHHEKIQDLRGLWVLRDIIVESSPL